MKKSEQALTLKGNVITGFSYSFAQILLNKLKKLKEENRIFTEGLPVSQDDDDISSSYNHGTTSIASAVLHYLYEQVPYECNGSPDSTNSKEINRLIACADEFLTTFQQPPRP